MTPTTITVILWNYCQNRCSYCVSESNKDEWKLKGKTKVWKPDGEECLNFFQLADKYGIDFHDRMCPEPDQYLKAKDVIEYKYAIEWIKKYRPDAHVHLSGGEPLLRPDIEDIVAAFSKEFPTTIITNGQLIHKYPRLLDMNIKWLVSYHRGQVNINDFLVQIELIKNKPHLITCVVNDMTSDNSIEKSAFSSFNFEYKLNSKNKINKDFVYDKEDLKDIASRRIMLIQPNGPVNGCNKMHRGPADRYKSESNVYTMECDEKHLEINNERATRCVMNNRCSAYQTAVKVYNLKG